jgi:hypothetical protein
MADILNSLGDAATGFADFVRGKVPGLLSPEDRPVPYKKGAPPSADWSKKLSEMAEESARRNGVKKKTVPMMPAARKALTSPK